jgi:hypothetical protein
VLLDWAASAKRLRDNLLQKIRINVKLTNSMNTSALLHSLAGDLSSRRFDCPRGKRATKNFSAKIQRNHDPESEGGKG